MKIGFKLRYHFLIEESWKMMILLPLSLSALLLVAVASGQGYKDVTTKQFQDECLREHNKYRAKHGAPPLALDNEVMHHAKVRGDKLGSTGVWDHDRPYTTKHKLGENLYNMPVESPQSCASAVKLWYDEVKDYDLRAHKPKPGAGMTGHFTRLVWKSSTKLGCRQVIVSHGEKGAYIVCMYSPPGNYPNRHAENVS